MNDKALNIKIPNEMYEKLKKISERKSISLASMVRMIVSEWFEQKQ